MGWQKDMEFVIPLNFEIPWDRAHGALALALFISVLQSLFCESSVLTGTKNRYWPLWFLLWSFVG